MSQTTNIPGLPPNFHAQLPVAVTMTVTIPARVPYQDNRTGQVLNNGRSVGGF